MSLSCKVTFCLLAASAKSETEDTNPVLAPAGEVLGPHKNHENPALHAVFPYRIHGMGRPDIEVARRTYALRRVKSHRVWHQEETNPANRVENVTSPAKA